MIVVFLGPPGSGKGTQAKKLKEKLNGPHLSTGDMFRAAIQQATPVGLKAKTFMDKGELVPDSVVLGLIEERIGESDCKKGFVLDGFPRTEVQAEGLEQSLKKKNFSLDHVIYFEIANDEVVERISGRRFCSKCGKTYHLTGAKPKKVGVCDDHPDEKLIQRDDDKEDVVRKRLEVYTQQTAPLVAYYKKTGKLQTIDASATADVVQRSLLSKLGLK